MQDNFINGLSCVSNNILLSVTGEFIRNEVTAWVTLIGTVAVTLTTIGIQVYKLIKNRDKKEDTDKDNKDNE